MSTHSLRRLLRRKTLSSARRVAAPRVPEMALQFEDMTLYRSTSGTLWLHRGDAGGMPVEEKTVAAMLREHWEREF